MLGFSIRNTSVNILYKFRCEFVRQKFGPLIRLHEKHKPLYLNRRQSFENPFFIFIVAFVEQL